MVVTTIVVVGIVGERSWRSRIRPVHPRGGVFGILTTWLPSKPWTLTQTSSNMHDATSSD